MYYSPVVVNIQHQNLLVPFAFTELFYPFTYYKVLNNDNRREKINVLFS